jgi:hypothetical protein
MKELLTALCKAKQQFMPIGKDKANSHLKYKYASLDSVLAAVEPALHAHELMLSSSVVDGCLITRLYHISGEYLESSFKLPDIADPQKIGSAITYYRRYTICGLLSITADEDDDGVAARPPAKAAYTAPPPAAIAKPSQKIIETQEALTDCMEILGWSKEQKVAWAKTISPKSCDLWDLNTWELAIVKALSAIDMMNSEVVA